MGGVYPPFFWRLIMSDKQLIEMIAQGHAQRIAQDRQQQQIMAAYDQWKQQQQIMAEFDAWKASQPQAQPAQSVQEIPSIKTAQPQRDLQAEAREYFANVRKERREQEAEAKRLKEQQLTATLNDYAKQQQEENELASISANKRKEPKVGQRPEPIDFSSPVAARGLDESTIKGGEKWKQSVNDTLNVLNSKEMKDINRYQKLVNANEEKAAKEAKKEMSNINNGINQLDLSQYNLPSESGFTEQEQKAFEDYTKALKWSDPNYRMTKEEQQEARRIASEGKQALAEKYPVENKADFGKLYERMSPEDQEKYRTYDNLSLKSDPVSVASVGAADKAVNMLGGALNTLALFHPGAIPAARDYQKLQKKWNEGMEETETEAIAKSATPLAENVPLIGEITPYGVGQAATQIGAYALTNNMFDEAGAALLGDKLGKVGGFIGNQIGQNAQDIALDTIPRYQELKAQGKSDEEIRDTLIQEGIWNSVGNLTLGALGEIPGLWKSAKNSSAARKAADEAFRQNITEGADKLARLAGTEDVDNVVRNATRQYEEAAQNIENLAKQMPETGDMTKAMDAEDAVKANLSIQEVNRKGGKKGYYVSEELPEGGSRNVETGKVYKTREEAEKALQEYRNVSESAKMPEVNSAQIDLNALKKEANNMKTSFREKAKYLGDTDNPYARKFLESVDEFTKDPSVDTYEMMVSAHNDYMANYNKDIWKPSKTGYYHPEYHSEQIVKRLDDIAEKYGFKNGPQNDDLIKNSLDNVNTSVYDEGVKNVDANNGGIDYGTDISKGYDGTAGEGILRTDSTERPLGSRVSADGVSGGKYLPSDRVSVSDNVTKYSKVFDDADAQKLTESKIPYNDYYDVQEPELFSKSLETAKANNPHGGAVDSHTPEEIQEILNNNGKTFLTADGTAGGAVDNGNLTAVFKDNLNNDTPRAASSIAIAGVKNGAIKGDCFGKFLVNSYSKAGFEPVARMKYVYGFNELMDKQVKEQLAQGLIKSEPDVYVLKLKDGYDYQKAIDGYKTAKIWSQQELDSLPLYDDYDEMLKYRDSLIKMDLQTFAEKQPGTGAFSNGVNPDDVMKERGTSRHIRNDGTPMKMEGVSEEVAADFEKNPDMYKAIRNADTKAKADKIYNESENPEIEFRDLLAKKDPAALPLGHQIAKDYSAAGNYQAAAQIYRDMGKGLTEAGQFSQAAIINMVKDDPMTAFEYAVREIDNLNKSGVERFGKKWKNFELTPEEAKAFKNIKPGDTEAIKSLYESIGDRLGKEYPTTLMEKLIEARRVAMLFNPRTNVRNLGANPPTLAMRWMSDRVEAVGQKIAHLINKDIKVTQSLYGSGLRGRKMAKEVWNSEQVQALFKGSGSKADIPNLKSSLMENKQVFKGNAVEKWIDKITNNGIQRANEKFFGKKGVQSFLETARNATYKLLDLGDTPFVKENFVERLGSYISASKIKNIDDIPDEAIQMAWEEAMKATYKDNSTFVKGLRKLKTGIQDIGNSAVPGLGDAVSQAAIPYLQAPGNIAQRMVDYSGIGATKGISNIIKGATGGDVKLVEKGIEEAAKGLTGTSLVLLGMRLRQSGVLTGTYSENKRQREFEKMNGFKEFAIHAGDKYFTYGWMQPFAQELMVGTLLADAIEKSDEYDSDILNYFGIEGSSAGKALGVAKAGSKAAVNSWFNESPLSGLADFFKGNSYSDTDIAGNIWENGVEDFASALVPSVVSATAKVADPVQRNAYDPSNAFATFINSNVAKLPGLSKNLPAKYDAWGQEMRYAESKGAAAASKYLIPGDYSYDKADEIDSEINRLFNEGVDKDGKLLKDNGVFPTMAPNKVGDKTLNNKEVSEYQKDMGQRSRTAVEAFITSDSYKNLPDAEKVEVLKGIYGASSAITKRDKFDTPLPENSSYKKVIAAYDEAGGGEKGAQAIANYYTQKKIADASGLDSDSNAYKEIQKDLAKGDTAAAEQKIDAAQQITDAGIGADGYNVYQARKSNISNIDGWITEYKNIDSLGNSDGFVNQDEFIAAIKKNNWSETEAVRQSKIYGNWKQIPYLKKDGTWGFHKTK